MAKKARRTQEERTRETKTALVDAAIRVVYRLGYGGATTAMIAEEAAVTRGALTHHFLSRADLMAEVVRVVYRRDMQLYGKLLADGRRGRRLADWPAMVWEVLGSQPAVAVLEILQATRSDEELAARVKPVQMAIEADSLAATIKFGGDERTRNAMARLVVWAIRGLTIEQTLVPDPTAVKDCVNLLTKILERAESGDELVI